MVITDQTIESRQARKEIRMSKNAAHEIVNFLHFVLAELWIVGVMASVSAGYLLIAVGGFLLVVNVLAVIFRVAATLEKDREWKQYKADLKEELRGEIFEEISASGKF